MRLASDTFLLGVLCSCVLGVSCRTTAGGQATSTTTTPVSTTSSASTALVSGLQSSTQTNSSSIASTVPSTTTTPRTLPINTSSASTAPVSGLQSSTLTLSSIASTETMISTSSTPFLITTLPITTTPITTTTSGLQSSIPVISSFASTVSSMSTTPRPLPITTTSESADPVSGLQSSTTTISSIASTVTSMSTTSRLLPITTSSESADPVSGLQSSTTMITPIASTGAFTQTIEVTGTLYGPLDGGTRFTLVGDPLIVAGTTPSSTVNYTVISAVYVGNSQAVVIESEFGKLVVKTPPANKTGLQNIKVFVVGHGILDTSRAFEYRSNTVVLGFDPLQHLFDGGTVINVTGTDMDSVAQPGIFATINVTRWNDTYLTRKNITSRAEECFVVNSGLMWCRMPVIDVPLDLRNGSTNSSVPGVASFIGSNGEDRADVHIGLVFDGSVRYQNISLPLPDIKMSFFPKPPLSCATDITFNPDTDTSFAIKGSDLTRGNRLVDVTVHIGDGVCKVTQLTDNEIVCQPPVKAPGKVNDSFCPNRDSLSVQVFIGYAVYHCSCLQYQRPDTSIPLIVGIVVGLGGGLIGIYLCVVVGVVCAKRRRKKNNSEPTTSQTYGMELPQVYDTTLQSISSGISRTGIGRTRTVGDNSFNARLGF